MRTIKDQPKIYKKALGQVFTSPDVAKVMVNLIKPFLDAKAECLDPCIGKNVFLKELSKYRHGFLTGVEFDNSLIEPSIRDFYKVNHRRLIIGNFFNLGLDKKFDVIIMNPPYLRQELLNDKDEMMRILRKNYLEIPGKSNLYVYFFLKALKHLKDKGALVAIIYDSWLFTDFGRTFKELILNNHSLGKIIHFKNGAFDNVNIGATIILINRRRKNEKIEYYSFDSPIDIPTNGSLPINKRRIILEKDILDFHKLWGNVIDFNNDIFYPISKLSVKPIVRGVNAIVNKFFIFDTDKFPPYTKKIIKRVADIRKI